MRYRLSLTQSRFKKISPQRNLSAYTRYSHTCQHLGVINAGNARSENDCPANEPDITG